METTLKVINSNQHILYTLFVIILIIITIMIIIKYFNSVISKISCCLVLFMSNMLLPSWEIY